jgi:hypothetical protein
MPTETRLTRAILWVVLVAAIATAPIFLFAESFDREHVVRVLLSNGLAAALCTALLAVLRRGHAASVGRWLVFGLFALVAALAWTNGEDIHVNVVNFVLVTVLASVLTRRRTFFAVAAFAAATMCRIAWVQAAPETGEELLEARLESIAQFLPTYCVIVLVLGFRREGRERERDPAGESPPIQTSE